MAFAYETEPFLRELFSEVHSVGMDGKRPYALLADTVLYPEGGGQPADRGWLGDVPVFDVQKRGREVRHYVERPVAAGPVLVRLDWDRRFDHMQQHTGQHLLTAVAADRFSWETLAFHLGTDVSTIEIGAPRPERAALDALEEAVAGEVRAARAVTTRSVPPGEMAALGVRSRGLPEEHEGDVRLVEIAGVDLNTCGGTHLTSTAQIEVLKIIGAEAHGKTSLLSFVAGGRARRRFGAVEGIASDLRTLLQAPDTGLVEAAKGKLEQLRASEKRTRDLSFALAAARAESLASGDGPLADAHENEADLAFLQEIAKAFVARAPRKALLLTGGAGPAGVFVLAVGEALPADPSALGRAVAEALSGRGGGSGRIFQGRANALSARPAAVEKLRAALSLLE